MTDSEQQVVALERLNFEYTNEQGNARVKREVINHDTFVREVDIEEMFNYVAEQWETISRFTRDYDLAQDGETLKGDGSNWRGTGRNWEEWFEQRHIERLRIRFPHDEVSA